MLEFFLPVDVPLWIESVPAATSIDSASIESTTSAMNSATTVGLLTESVREKFQIIAALPWLLLALLAAPMVAIAVKLRAFPTWWWMALLATSLVLSALTIAFPVLLLVTLAIDGLLVVIATVDLIWLCAGARVGIEVTREVPRTCSLGVPVQSQIVVENRTSMRLMGRVRDDTPTHFVSEPDSHEVFLARMDRMTARRTITPTRRGAFDLTRVDLQLDSPLRFWRRLVTRDVVDRLNVYPDMKQLSDYALLARTNRLSQIGVRRTRKIGQDSEFERLRDYTRDDNYRHIDWRSTARRNRLTVRQFQTDHSQRVIFMLDCGRMMTNSRIDESGGEYSLLDYAFNSMLMMSYVALAQGDSVGLLCFSDRVHAYIPPRGGASHMNRLIQAGFDQFPRLVESRYDQAFMYLSRQCRRRSLVALATNVIDEVNARAVVNHLSNINGEHLPLGILLRDRVMFDAADGYEQLIGRGGELDVGKSDQMTMYRSAAAADILLWRDTVIADLHQKGVLVVDEFPDQLTAPLVNEYLEVKAKHLL